MSESKTTQAELVDSKCAQSISHAHSWQIVPNQSVMESHEISGFKQWIHMSLLIHSFPDEGIVRTVPYFWTGRRFPSHLVIDYLPQLYLLPKCHVMILAVDSYHILHNNRFLINTLTYHTQVNGCMMIVTINPSIFNRHMTVKHLYRYG